MTVIAIRKLLRASAAPAVLLPALPAGAFFEDLCISKKTDGPLYHYVLAFSPNGQGTDVHGAGGVQAVYPFHYPPPGYPGALDDIYQGTLYNLRQWAMQAGSGPGLLCTAGLTSWARPI